MYKFGGPYWKILYYNYPLYEKRFPLSAMAAYDKILKPTERGHVIIKDYSVSRKLLYETDVGPVDH